MKLGKILRKNNKTAVLEEYRYQTERLDLTPKQAKKVRDKKKEIAKDDYVFSDEKAKEYVPWLDRLWLNHDQTLDRKSTRLNSSHANISYAVFCLKKKKSNIKHK